MEGTEFVAGVGAEVFGEGAAEVLVRGEGVGGPAVRAQGTEQKAVEAFVVRVGRGQPAQLGYERGGAPRAQVGLDPAAYGGVPQVLRVAGLRRRLGQVGERGAAPEPECATQDFRGLRVGVRVERGGALAEQVLEPVQVDVTPLRHEPVAARPRGERLVPEGFAQPPDERLQRGGGIPGWLAAPHLVHEGARGHLTAGAQRECGEQRAQPGTAERHGRAVGGVGLGGTEDAVLHLAIVHEGWGWERMFGAVWRGVPGNGVRAGRPPPTRGAPLHPFFRVHPPAPGHPPTSVDNSGRKNNRATRPSEEMCSEQRASRTCAYAAGTGASRGRSGSPGRLVCPEAVRCYGPHVRGPFRGRAQSLIVGRIARAAVRPPVTLSKSARALG
ncbi:hypothetical protein GA0115252_14933 [Streptomyces sp. DfronAA-171]|nr:hypothetical protein GA0115252_14933 [Streptomyces sp. DfronAA-171]